MPLGAPIPEPQNPPPQPPATPSDIPHSEFRNPHSADPSPLTPHPSPARLRANRANAQKSTGPRLPCGKAASSANAVKHAIFARDRFIERGQGAEDPADFREVLAETRRIYQPEGPRQDALAERIADCTWRLLRLRRFEIGAIHRRIDTDPDAPPPADPQLDERIADFQERIAAYGDAIAAALDAPSNSAEDLEPLREAAARELLLTTPKFTLPETMRMLSGLSKPAGRTADQVRAQVIQDYQRLIQREQASLAQIRPSQEHAALEADYRAERERLLYSIPETHDAYLLIRYETMLTRSRDKAVRELDELQARRD